MGMTDTVRNEKIRAWMDKWGLTPADLRGLAAQLTEAADFIATVSDLEPNLGIRLGLPPEASRELAIILGWTKP